MNILIIGATSAIAKECAKIYAQGENSFYLYGRNKIKLHSLSEELSIIGTQNIYIDTFNAEDHQESAIVMIERAKKKLNSIDLVIIAHGIMPNHNECEKSLNTVHEIININFLSIVSYLTVLAKYFRDQGIGNIVVIGSVAGDRIRKSNYIYGLSKASLAHFIDGFRLSLIDCGIKVLLIKPGFVTTPMTDHLNNNGFLWASPEKIAFDIKKGIKRNKSIIYSPWYWYWILLIIRNIPNWLFKRLNF